MASIKITGLDDRRILGARVRARLGEALRPVDQPAVKAHVAFIDDNGPKGGRALRCGITVVLPRRPSVHVEHLAETARLAFDGAIAALDRQLARQRGRQRDRRRRPKKYFVAKRLLGGEEEGQT